MLQDGTTTKDQFGSYEQMTLSVFINFIIDNVKAKDVNNINRDLTKEWEDIQSKIVPPKKEGSKEEFKYGYYT